MKIYQINNNLKRIYYNFDIKDAKTLEDIIKIISKNRDELLVYNNMFRSYGVYIENIPKRICKFKEITVVIDELSNSIRYFSSLCN